METLIEKQRKKNKIKVYELAHLLSIDASLMSRILSGKRIPSDQQLQNLASILAVPYEELLKDKIRLKIIELLKPYPYLAKEVLQMVEEERVAYLSSNRKFELINLDHLQGSLNELTKLQQKWAAQRPLDTLQLQKMLEYFHTSYTYESNQIEGNTLDFQETHLVINEGITIGGKSMREHLEAINHREAIDLIIDLVRRSIDLSAHTLKEIHQLILKGIHSKGAGVYRQSAVRISGSRHLPPDAYRIEELMENYFHFYHFQKRQLHPVILAAEMHERLVTIHPFIDGNGRTSRLVMNLILLQNGYPIVSLRGDADNRKRYYHALEQVQIDHNHDDFYRLIIERTKASLLEHLALC